MPQVDEVAGLVSNMRAPVLFLAGAVKRRGVPPMQFRLEVPHFAVDASDFVAVVGESGCGKSTLLDMLALISRPDAAQSFAISGHDVALHDISAMWRTGAERSLSALRARDIGYVLQTGGLLPFLTVMGNAELAIALADLQPDPARIRMLAESLGIADHLAKRPYELSGGQRQRAAILRALAHRPRLVLADEPTAAVDKSRAKRIVSDFRSIARGEGSSVVMVTHDVSLVEDVADRRFGFTLNAPSQQAGTVSTCREMLA